MSDRQDNHDKPETDVEHVMWQDAQQRRREEDQEVVMSTLHMNFENPETAALARWLDAERDTAIWTMMVTTKTRLDLAVALQDWVEQRIPHVHPTVFYDILLTALHEVDWVALAAHLRANQYSRRLHDEP